MLEVLVFVILSPLPLLLFHSLFVTQFQSKMLKMTLTVLDCVCAVVGPFAVADVVLV